MRFLVLTLLVVLCSCEQKPLYRDVTIVLVHRQEEANPKGAQYYDYTVFEDDKSHVRFERQGRPIGAVGDKMRLNVYASGIKQVGDGF